MSTEGSPKSSFILTIILILISKSYSAPDPLLPWNMDRYLSPDLSNNLLDIPRPLTLRMPLMMSHLFHPRRRLALVVKHKVLSDEELITEGLKGLKPSDFDSDPSVQLSIGVGPGGDGVWSVYNLIEGKWAQGVLFRREGDDKGKDVIVLSGSQDHLRTGKNKKTYLVMKANPKEKDQFHLFYAYITSEGTDKKVEWDLFDCRGSFADKLHAFGWTSCGQSSFVSCKDQKLKEAKPEYLDSVEHISMPDAKYDYYLDLRNDPLESFTVGFTTSVLSRGPIQTALKSSAFESALGTKFLGKSRTKRSSHGRHHHHHRRHHHDYDSDDYDSEESEERPRDHSHHNSHKGRSGAHGRSFFGMFGGGAAAQAAGNEKVDIAKLEDVLKTLTQAQVAAALLKEAAADIKKKYPDGPPKANSTDGEEIGVRDMQPGTIATLEDGDMLHRRVNTEDPDKEFILLPKAGGAKPLTGKEVDEKYGESSSTTSTTKVKVTPASNFGLLGDLGSAVGDLLGNVGGLLTGGLKDSAGNSMGLLGGLGSTVGGLLGGVGGTLGNLVSNVDSLISSGRKKRDIENEVLARKERGWLFGDGSQQGNGCTGLFGFIGFVLGNRKGCGESVDTVTIVNQPQPGYGPPPGYSRKKRDASEVESRGELLAKAETRSMALANGLINQALELQEPMNAALFGKTGWLTQDFPTYHLTLASSTWDLPFIGLGMCPYFPKKIEQVSTTENAIDFYLNVLRTGCQVGKGGSGTKDKLIQLAKEGCLHLVEIKDKKALDVPKGCNYLSKPKLTSEEQDKLGEAFEISVFSQSYLKEEDYTSSKSKLAIASKPIQTLGSVVLQSFKKAEELAPIHVIKLTRWTVKTMKFALAKAIQDLLRYQDCKQCDQVDIYMAENNAKAVVELVQFVSMAVEPSKKVELKDLDEFSQANGLLVRKKFGQYII